MVLPVSQRLELPRRGRELAFTWNGQRFASHEGETIAAALLANGIFALRRTARGDARGVFCGMGSCFECRVQIGTADSATTVRACVTPVMDGMTVETHVESGVESPAPIAGEATRG